MKLVVLFAAAISSFGQTPKPPARATDPAQCAALRHRGDPDLRQCYQRLTLASDPGIQAEGFWGLRDYKTAFNDFWTAIDRNPKDPKLRARLGRMLIEHWQPGD